jgi:hypothetical protein
LVVFGTLTISAIAKTMNRGTNLFIKTPLTKSKKP